MERAMEVIGQHPSVQQHVHQMPGQDLGIEEAEDDHFMLTLCKSCHSMSWCWWFFRVQWRLGHSSQQGKMCKVALDKLVLLLLMVMMLLLGYKSFICLGSAVDHQSASQPLTTCIQFHPLHCLCGWDPLYRSPSVGMVRMEQSSCWWPRCFQWQGW